MPETPVVPFIPRSSLFIAGMTAQCRALNAVVAHALKEDVIAPARRDHILEKLIRSLPVLPAALDPAEIDALAAMTPAQVWTLSERHRGRTVEVLRELWERTALALDDVAERDFARRCGILLTELFRRGSRRSGTRPAADRKNA